MKHYTAYRRDRHYASFPYIAAAPDGRLLAVFREAGEATAQAALSGTHTHQDPDSRILFSQSHDGGRSWSDATSVYEGEYAASDPAVAILQSGRYLVRFARWSLVPVGRRADLPGPVMRHYLGQGRVGAIAGNGFVESRDEGKTWQPLNCQVCDTSLASAVSREAPLELADGTLLLPVYEGYPFHSDCAWLLRSWDGGTTWRDGTFVAGHRYPPRGYRETESFNETSILAVGSNSLLAVIRVDASYMTEDAAFISEGGLGELAWTMSHDAGFTWNPLQSTGLWGQPGHLLRLRDGRVLCTYGYRRKPYGIRATAVNLDGDGWRPTHHLVLRDDAAGWDIGYPSSVQLAGDEVYSMYYFHGRDGVRYIAGTRWSLGEMQAARE